MRDQSSVRRDGIVVASGYGLRLHVQRGHLIVHDGIGRKRETRRYHRATSGLKRLVVIGHTGFVSFEALRWLRDIGAAYIQFDNRGELLVASASPGSSRPALRRAQALAPSNSVGLELARSVLQTKVDGQASLLADLPSGASAETTVSHARRAVASAETVTELVAAEASAAAAYWDAWASLPVRWGKREGERVPEHWYAFNQRHSQLTRSPRLATNPANAMLNYLYALLEAETTLACHALGLDPGLGIFHEDTNARDSLALDLMEACRPAVDAYLLALLTSRTFRASDFAETRRGGCRLFPPLASELAETAPTWRRQIAPVAEGAAARLAESRGQTAPTPLTQTARRAAWNGRRSKRTKQQVAVPRLRPVCEVCGGPLTKATRTYCDACHRQRFMEAGISGRTEAAKVLAQLRANGADPRHGGEAARRRGSKNAAHQRSIGEWVRHNAAAPDPEAFRRDILPGLAHVRLSDLVEATGLSEHYCSLIRLGKRTPHPRHWARFRAVAEAAVAASPGRT